VALVPELATYSPLLQSLQATHATALAVVL
jgi:hypothetical protein